MNKYLFSSLVALLFLTSCVPKSDYEKLQSELEQLKIELDEYKYGAEKLHGSMAVNFENGEYSVCKDIYYKMENMHPESELFEEVKGTYDKIIKIENEQAEKSRLLQEKREREAKAKSEREERERLQALNKLRKNFDDVSGITWYKNSYFEHYYNTFRTSIYIGDNGSTKWLRLRMSYVGEDWIFFEKAFLSYDGNTMEVPFDEYDDKDSENSGGKVWEWIDVSVSKSLEDFLRECAKSPNAKMRLSGKYTKTRTLSWNERQGILDVLKGYDALMAEK